jgi:tetratricopeptide (TPR) repeat protein
MVLAGSLAGVQRLPAQAPAGKDAAPADAPKPSNSTPPANANPFPDDTSSVPVLQSTGTPALPAGTYDGSERDALGSAAFLPGEDTDPVRSPDDPAPAASSGPEEDSSSSLKGLENLLPPPDSDEPQGKHKKLHVTKEPTHQEAASSDIDVGGYYLDRKNWRAALSRFQSAMVLDPENPEVYWGLAEAERNLGQFANARQHYEKLLDYDPDGKHGKEARKALKDPALAAARNPVPGQNTPPAQQ